MKSAVSLADASAIEDADIFDLYAAYQETVDAQPRDTEKRQGYFHPSANGMCARRNVYEYIRAPVGMGHKFADQEIYDMGHAVHGMLQSKTHLLREHFDTKGFDIEFQAEVPYDPSTDELFQMFGIGGTTDGLLSVTRRSDGARQDGVVEYKSINDDGFSKLTCAKPDHIRQGTLYAYRFNRPIIWVWYFNKNNSRSVVYPYRFSMDVLNETLLMYTGWLEHVAAGTLPDREEDWYACPRCEYREICQPPSIRAVSKLADARLKNNLKKKDSRWA